MADRCRCCSIAARPAISPPCWPSAGNTRSAPISARRWRSGLPTSPSRRRQPHVRRLSAGAALLGRDVLGALSARARHRRRPAGGARGAADHDGLAFSLARRSNSARWCWRGRSGRCCCCIPGRSIGQSRRNAWFAWSIEAGLLLLTTLGGDRPVAAGRRLCARDRARTAHADVVRSAVRAAGDRRAGAALSDLADPRRRAGDAALACDRAICAARALHWAGLLGGLLLAMSGIVAAGGAQFRLVRPQCRRRRRSSTGRRSIRWRAISSISSPSRRRWRGSLIAGLFNLDRVVGGAGVALLMSGLAVIVATGDLIQLRRQRLLRSVWAAAIVAPALGVDRRDAVSALDRRARSADLAAGDARSRISSATVLSGAPISGCARWPAIRSLRA